MIALDAEGWMQLAIDRHNRILELATELNKARDDAAELRKSLSKLNVAIDGLSQDAERYRWLREQHWNDSAIAVVCSPKESVKLGSYCPSEKLLDQAIDAALDLEIASD